MKVCLINNLYKPYNRGGAESIAEAMAKDFLSRGDEVLIITTKPIQSDINAPEISDRIKISYIPGLYYNLSKLPLLLRIPWHILDMFDIGSYFRIKHIVSQEKPDLVITHNLKGIGYLIPRVIKKLGVRHIHYLHDIQLTYPSGVLYYGEEKKLDGLCAKLYQRICRRLFGSPDEVVSPTRWLLDWHVKMGFFKNSKLTVKLPEIKNVSAGLMQRQGIKYEESRPKKFLFVGQLEKHKGIEVLVEAFMGLSINTELAIIGTGSLSEAIKEKIKDHPGINILPVKTHEDVLNLMAGSDVLIVPSLCYENAPTVILEAASQGLPVIASRIGGISEIIEKHGGRLFTPGDVEELKKLMDKDSS